MNIRKSIISLFSVAAIVGIAGMANAETRPFMARGEVVEAPPGYTDLCLRDEAHCGSFTPQTTAATPLVMAALSTASLGQAWPLAMAALQDQVPAVTEDTDQLTLLEVESLLVYQPEAAVDFLPAGVVRPIAEAAVKAPVMMADGSAALAKGQMKLITKINQAVNRDVRKSSDLDLYGMPEFWSLPRVIDGKMYGDCEDYALEKRRRLIEAGVSSDALTLAVVITRSGERHAVLVAAFDAGDVVLDNLTPWPTPWAELGYTWVQRQVAGTSTWTTVG
ncbi:transglutaminase-like cysteine peptidase [Caulobacter henricii]|uniref:Cysteine protease n=1 Tax=Caulobacter henricii TaxID=69395 RepID=A0A0P0P3B4_9CAUL|nr:transglutaminase-like cysteine peptidase [Caulobacter henricii]ALL14892.1 hypothetical protein AQ619_16815 [Caulobacter henricii]